MGSQYVMLGSRGRPLVRPFMGFGQDPTEPISTISFYPDGSWFTSAPVGNKVAIEWTDAMAAALGVEKLASSEEMLKAAKTKPMWKWATLGGIPGALILGGLAGWFIGKRR